MGARMGGPPIGGVAVLLSRRRSLRHLTNRGAWSSRASAPDPSHGWQVSFRVQIRFELCDDTTGAKVTWDSHTEYLASATKSEAQDAYVRMLDRLFAALCTPEVKPR